MTTEAEKKILDELAELKRLFLQMVNPAQALDIREKADIIRKAQATGNRKQIRHAYSQINKTAVHGKGGQ